MDYPQTMYIFTFYELGLLKGPIQMEIQSSLNEHVWNKPNHYGKVFPIEF